MSVISVLEEIIAEVPTIAEEVPAIIGLVGDIVSFIKSNGGAPELSQALADLSKVYAAVDTAILALIHPEAVSPPATPAAPATPPAPASK